MGSITTEVERGKVYARIESRFQEFIDDLSEFARVPTISAARQAGREGAEATVKVLEKHGVKSRLMDVEGGPPMVVGEVSVDPALPTLILYNHYDVQPVDPLHEWKHHPFEPVVEDGRLHARGVADTKGNAVAQALAQAAIREVTGGLPVNLRFMIEGEEEVGSPHLPGFARKHPELFRGDGATIEDVQQIIRAAVGGDKAGQIFEGIPRFDILVRYAPESRNSAEAIGRIVVPASGGLTVPLANLATIEEIVGPRQITRENAQRFITVQCNVRGRDIGSFVEEAQRAIDTKVQLPPGYFVSWGGQFQLQQEANKRLAVVIPMTLLIVFLLLYSTFNSLKNSLLILLNIPLALVGGVAGLWLTEQNLSVPASVGFIALFGIALANGMVLVTYLNQLLREGIPMRETCIRGACLRLRPVLMTASAAGLGLVPMVLSHGTGSEVQRPLATVVIGGLVTSTALTLLVIPALYRWFAIAPEGEVPAAERREGYERDQSIHPAPQVVGGHVSPAQGGGPDRDERR